VKARQLVWPAAHLCEPTQAGGPAKERHLDDNMAKHPKAGQCVHCLRHSEKMTWDHVFPQAWYPATTPANLEKWKIPACLKCNNDYGKLERDLLIRLGLCVPPDAAAAAGVPAKVLRSLDPKAAKSDRDRRIRAADRSRVLRELLPFGVPPAGGVLPGFGLQSESQYSDYAGILIPAGSLERLGEKLIRGITYVHHGALLGAPYRVRVYVITDAAAGPMGRLIERHARVFDRGPGIAVFRSEAEDDPLVALYKVVVWGRLVLFGAVLGDRFGDGDVS
jgi:hypothetical protein